MQLVAHAYTHRCWITQLRLAVCDARLRILRFGYAAFCPHIYTLRAPRYYALVAFTRTHVPVGLRLRILWTVTLKLVARLPLPRTRLRIHTRYDALFTFCVRGDCLPVRTTLLNFVGVVALRLITLRLPILLPTLRCYVLRCCSLPHVTFTHVTFCCFVVTLLLRLIADFTFTRFC